MILTFPKLLANFYIFIGSYNIPKNNPYYDMVTLIKNSMISHERGKENRLVILKLQEAIKRKEQVFQTKQFNDKCINSKNKMKGFWNFIKGHNYVNTPSQVFNRNLAPYSKNSDIFFTGFDLPIDSFAASVTIFFQVSHT
jgi:hypothetical protein